MKKEERVVDIWEDLRLSAVGRGGQGQLGVRSFDGVRLDECMATWGEHEFRVEKIVDLSTELGR